MNQQDSQTRPEARRFKNIAEMALANREPQKTVEKRLAQEEATEVFEMMKYLLILEGKALSKVRRCFHSFPDKDFSILIAKNDDPAFERYFGRPGVRRSKDG